MTRKHVHVRTNREKPRKTTAEQNGSRGDPWCQDREWRGFSEYFCLASKYSPEFSFLLQLRKIINIVIWKYPTGGGSSLAIWTPKWPRSCTQSASSQLAALASGRPGLRVCRLPTSWLDSQVSAAAAALRRWLQTVSFAPWGFSPVTAGVSHPFLKEWWYLRSSFVHCSCLSPLIG